MKPGISSAVSVVSAEHAGAGSIKEGSEVFVRVLADEGAGRYSVSFAGQRFSVYSARALESGAAFKALVRVQNGIVLLIPRESAHFSARHNAGVQRFASFTADSSGKLHTFLQQLGLPADNLSFRLVQFFQESALRFNKELALKARNAAKRFAGREEKAAHAALLLLEKGLEADDDSINALLYVLYAQDGGRRHNESDSGAGQNRDTRAQEGGDSFIPLIYGSTDCLSLPAGLLSFLNQYKTSDNHWVFLPFDYDIGDNLFNGVIRVLVNLKEKKTEKVIISAFSATKTYLFMLYFNGRVDGKDTFGLNIDYCVEPGISNNKVETVNHLLRRVLSNADCTIRYRPDLIRCGGGTAAAPLSLVEVHA